MTSKTAADALVETLIAWDVDTIFGLPGDGINGIMESLRKREDQIRFIQVRHEESAAFMACGYAKYTGKLGVCLATSGPGGIHLLNGLYDAKMDGAPVLAITGMHHSDLLNTFAQQDIDLDRVFQDVASYNARVMGPTHVEALTNLACKEALSHRGVSHIAFPVDFQSEEVDFKSDATQRNIKGHSSAIAYNVSINADEAYLDMAAAYIEKAKKPVILAGRGALHATDQLIEFADKIGAPIVKALLGKAAVPDDHPLTTGGIGLLGTKPSQEAMEHCDLLIMVGTSFPYIEFYPEPGSVKAIQIDIDPVRIGLRYPVDVSLVGDSSTVLQSLTAKVPMSKNRSFLERIQREKASWLETMEELATRDEVPVKPQVVAYELGKQLSDNAVVSCDSGTITTWWARHIPAKRGQLHSCSGTLASMACGLPYAIAAAIAFPERQSVAFVGDGGFSMLMPELITCVKYNLPVKIVIIKNNTLGQIKWEQMVFLGNPEFACELEPIDFVKYAEACGVKGLYLKKPDEAKTVFEEAFAHDGPVLVEAEVDPFEPPMPAKVTLKQAKKFGQSLLKGTPNKKEIALTALKTKVREMI